MDNPRNLTVVLVADRDDRRADATMVFLFDGLLSDDDAIARVIADLNEAADEEAIADAENGPSADDDLPFLWDEDNIHRAYDISVRHH